MKEQKMTAKEFAANCIQFGREFELKYCDDPVTGYDEYCVHIILGNCEHVIRCSEEHRLATLWREIAEYWLD